MTIVKVSVIIPTPSVKYEVKHFGQSMLSFVRIALIEERALSQEAVYSIKALRL